MEKPAIDFHSLDLSNRLDFALRFPAAYFVTGEDNLKFSAMNSATGVTLTIAGRFMQLNGEPIPFVHTLTPATDRTLSSITRALGNGWILDFTVQATVGAPLIGQCWALVQIQRGLGGATMLIGTLVSGYVTAVQPISFPTGKVMGSLDGPGCVRSVAGANPAPGADWIITVPAGARWRLISVTARLVTSATVVNRGARLRIDDGTNALWISDPGALQTAGNDVRYQGGDNTQRQTASYDAQVWGLPRKPLLLAGYTIQSATGGLEIDDDWSAPRAWVEEWIEGA